MQEIIAALISFFLIGPVQAHIAERYVDAGLSRQAASEAASCFSQATPGILRRVGSEPGWAVRHAIGYWIGTSSIEAIISDAAPQCAMTAEDAPGPTASARYDPEPSGG